MNFIWRVKDILQPRIYFSVFLIPLIYNPWGGASPYELTKQSWFFIVVGIYLVLLLGSLWQKKNFNVYANKIVFWIVFLWLCSFAISTFLSIAPIESFWGTYQRMQGTITYIYYVIHFVFCLNLFQDKKNHAVFFELTVFLGVLLSIYAFLQKIGIDPLRHIPNSLFAGRSFATIGNPTELGQFLIFPFFAGLLLSFSKWKNDRKRSLLFLSVSLLIFAAIFFAKNRASILGIVFSLLLAVLLELNSFKKKIIAVSVFLVLAAGLFFMFKSDLRSLGSRYVLWISSIPLISQHFLFGSGPETYYQTVQTVLKPELYLFERLTDIPDRSHNELMDVILERGLMGFLLYVVNLVFLAWVVLKNKLKSRVAKIAFLTIVAHTISMQFSFPSSSETVFLLGTWAILLVSTLNFRKITIHFSRILKVLLSIFIVFLITFSFYLSYSLIKTDVLFGQAISAYFHSEEESLAVFNKVVSQSPQYGYLYKSIFIFFNNYSRSYPLITMQLEKYSERFKKITNSSFQYYLTKAELEVAKQNWDQADEYFNLVAMKAPNWPILWLTWGRLLFEDGNYGDAVVKFKKLLELAPPYWRWLPKLKEFDFEQQEKYRIFRISNQSFFEALAMLVESYKRIGRVTEALTLEAYL